MADEVVEIVVVASRITNAGVHATLPSWLDAWINVPPSYKTEEWSYGPYANKVADYTSPNHPRKIIIVNAVESLKMDTKH